MTESVIHQVVQNPVEQFNTEAAGLSENPARVKPESLSQASSVELAKEFGMEGIVACFSFVAMIAPSSTMPSGDGANATCVLTPPIGHGLCLFRRDWIQVVSNVTKLLHGGRRKRCGTSPLNRDFKVDWTDFDVRAGAITLDEQPTHPLFYSSRLS